VPEPLPHVSYYRDYWFCFVAAFIRPSLPRRRRHSCALIMLQATRDIRKVAHWLGHSDIRTTEIYLRIDPSEKLEASEAVSLLGLRCDRFKAPDALIASLFEPSVA
jgi:integrase/recombinase XerD